MPSDSADLRAQAKRWLDTWQRMAPELEAERLQQLRDLDDAESARIARELVWPIGTPGDDRGGDDAAGLVTLKALQQKLGAGG